MYMTAGHRNPAGSMLGVYLLLLPLENMLFLEFVDLCMDENTWMIKESEIDNY